jgi:hypothetical protein
MPQHMSNAVVSDVLADIANEFLAVEQEPTLSYTLGIRVSLIISEFLEDRDACAKLYDTKLNLSPEVRNMT